MAVIDSYSETMGEITKLTKATSKSDSLRTTVPTGIVKQFNLEEKDALEWNIDIIESKLAIMVKPIKQKRIEQPIKKQKKGPF
jgi:bifunctional DNA-binding transcriptional regulator/antitoxin component of YhaV-PrlF toxin-antitoxin module